MPTLKKIPVNPEVQPVPRFYYRRVEISSSVAYVNFTLDQGYYYILRKVTFKAPGEDSPLTVQYPFLNIDIYNQGFNRHHNNNPGFLRLGSSPGQTGVIDTASPAPVDNNIFSRSFTATPVKNLKVFELILPNQGTMQFRITGQVFAAAWLPGYVDLVTEGHMIPYEQLEEWNQ